MSDNNDHWRTVLQRAMAALDFRITSLPNAVPTMVGEPAPQKKALPVMVYHAVAASAVVDTWVVAGDGEILIDRASVLARQRLLKAKVAEPPGSTPSPFSTGYAAAYKLELARLVWLAIIDDPGARLETLAATYAPPQRRIKLVE